VLRRRFPRDWARVLFGVLAFGIAPREARANLEEKTWVFHAPTRDLRVPRRGGLRGTPLVAIDDLLRPLNLAFTKDYARGRLRIEDPESGRHALFVVGEKSVATSFGPRDLSRRVRLEPKTRLFLAPLEIADRVLLPLLTGVAPVRPHATPPKLGEPKRPLVVLDPGHGGNDHGASVSLGAAGHLREKDLTLEIARDLRTRLEKRGVSVWLTRENDAYMTLPERSRFANAGKAALFVSLHLNAEVRGKRQGYELYVLSLEAGEAGVRQSIASENQIIPEDHGEDVEKVLADLRMSGNFERSLSLAKALQASLKTKATASARPVQVGPFYVLYGAEMPSVLWEMGFLTHAAERRALSDPKVRQGWLEAAAEALAKAALSGRVPSP